MWGASITVGEYQQAQRGKGEHPMPYTPLLGEAMGEGHGRGQQEEERAVYLGLGCHLPISSAPHLWNSWGLGCEDCWRRQEPCET